jgi:cystathionine beta-lyase
MALLNLTEQELRRRTSIKWRRYPADVLPMWVAEMDVATPVPVRDALVEAITIGDTGYPSGRRYPEAFSSYAEEVWGWPLDPALVHTVDAVMGSIHALLEVTTSPGDGVLINTPVYPPFRSVVTGYGRRLVTVPLTEDGRLDLPGIEEALSSDDAPRAYLLCSPHNPTGTVHTEDELASAAELCQRHGVYLIADEIHGFLVDPGTRFVPLLSLPQASSALAVTSAGKAWNLAGFHAGLVVFGPGSGLGPHALPPLASHSSGHLATIAHATALESAREWLDELRVELADNKLLVERLLAERIPGVRYSRQPGTYLAWLDCTELGLPDPAAHFLDRGRVAFNPGAEFDPAFSTWVRMNVATSPELVAEGISRMVSAME